MKDLIKEDNYRRAKKKVQKIKGFYNHLSIYLIVNLILSALHLYRSGWQVAYQQTINLAFFWGIGLVFHWYGVFGKSLLFGKDWEKRKLQELLDKEKKH